MFYSENLLSKTGPLAQAWVSANLERKLSKTHILQSNIESSVNTMIDQDTTSMALRLSGQLLLGVVRIYSQKARYLLSDCNETFFKIKMTFRSDKIGLSANMNVSDTAALTTMNRINDQTMPEINLSLPNFRLSNLDINEEYNDSFDWVSQLLSNSKTSESCRSVSKERRADDDSDDMNVELELDFGEDDTCMSTTRDVINGGMKFSNANNMCPNLEESHFLDGVTSPGSDNEVTMVNSQTRSQTHSLSICSRISIKKESQAHKVKKRSIIPIDVDTVIPITQIKQQQLDRSAILKPVSSLSRNPMLFGLVKMQQEGGFVPNIMYGDRVKGWAPEIKDLLSIDVMGRLGELKRKREEELQSQFENPNEEELQSQFEGPNEEEGSFSGNEGLYEDDTTICGSMKQGVISLDTQHAVHLLRGCFKSSEGDDSSTIFQKLLPETMTGKADATRMFFEVLVLATKSAVTVEQPDGQLDGPIRIQEKRGLWGFQAEEEAEVNIAVHMRLRDSRSIEPFFA